MQHAPYGIKNKYAGVKNYSKSFMQCQTDGKQFAAEKKSYGERKRNEKKTRKKHKSREIEGKEEDERFQK